MKVTLSDRFEQQIEQFDLAIQMAVFEFMAHTEKHGLKGLQGRNKSSAPTNPHTKKERANFAYAQKHCLWHYHIGIPCYVGEFGDRTSEYILHYQRFNDEIVLLNINTHPPFELPELD